MREFFPDGSPETGTDELSIRMYLAGQKLDIAYFVILNFSDGTSKGYTTLAHDYTLGSVTYEGAGDLLKISEIDETSSLEANGIKITLSGVDSTIAVLLSDTDWFREKISVYLGLFGNTNSDGSSRPYLKQASSPHEPIMIFDGRMDTLTMQEDGGSSTVVVTAESILADFERANPQRFTFANHTQRSGASRSGGGQGSAQIRGDSAFKHVTEMQKKVIKWGA